jgi:HEAT repeat protein
MDLIRQTHGPHVYEPALDDPLLTIRAFAITGLAVAKAPGAFERLIRLLGSDAVADKAEVNPYHHHLFRDLLLSRNHGRSVIREQAVIALGELGDKRAVETLIPMLKEPEEDLRREVESPINHIAAHRSD